MTFLIKHVEIKSVCGWEYFFTLSVETVQDIVGGMVGSPGSRALGTGSPVGLCGTWAKLRGEKQGTALGTAGRVPTGKEGRELYPVARCSSYRCVAALSANRNPLLCPNKCKLDLLP